MLLTSAENSVAVFTYNTQLFPYFWISFFLIYYFENRRCVFTHTAGGLLNMDPLDGGMRYTPGSSVRFILTLLTVIVL